MRPARVQGPLPIDFGRLSLTLLVAGTFLAGLLVSWLRRMEAASYSGFSRTIDGAQPISG